MEKYVNYCSWECGVEIAKTEGGQVFTPNGLPIRCIRHDGNMYEHEHGDHQDYKFPVDVEFQGDITEDHRKDFEMMCGRPAKDDGEVRDMNGQTHALIYTDGSVALTMYECCYAMWYCGTENAAEAPSGTRSGGSSPLGLSTRFEPSLGHRPSPSPRTAGCPLHQRRSSHLDHARISWAVREEPRRSWGGCLATDESGTPGDRVRPGKVASLDLALR